MPIEIVIPEAASIRRHAAALAAANTRTMQYQGGSDQDAMGLPVRIYFRQFAWTGVHVVQPLLQLDMSLTTVGEFFSVVDWEGTSPAQSEVTPLVDAPATSYAGVNQPEAFTPVETVSLDNFFDEYFTN